jgi:hypothetical protein
MERPAPRSFKLCSIAPDAREMRRRPLFLSNVRSVSFNYRHLSGQYCLWCEHRLNQRVETTMAKVTKMSNGYEFSGLSGIGMRLVNEFQRQFPWLSVPCSEPNFRFIRIGSSEENILLGKLVADVKARDPELTPPTFKTRT